MEKFLESLDVWKKKHAPWAATPAGWSVLMWLVRMDGADKPLKSLYLASAISEPTLRAALRLFVAAGIVSIVPQSGDHRVSVVRMTPKFSVALAKLSELLESRDREQHIQPSFSPFEFAELLSAQPSHDGSAASDVSAAS